MENLGKIFEKKLNQYGIKKQVDASLVCEAFNESVFEVFGKAGTENVRAISYKDGILKVGATSSAWASDVSLRHLELSVKKLKKIRYQIIKNQ